MHCRRCHKAGPYAQRWKETLTNASESHSRIQAAACRPIKLNIFLNRSLQRRVEQDSGFQLFIKSFAIMVVQSMSVASWDKAQPLPLIYQWRKTATSLLNSRTKFMHHGQPFNR